MKDFIEPFLYPHNLFLWGFLAAACWYRKTGLWCLLAWFYLFGNGYIANQVRGWYYQGIQSSVAVTATAGDFVVLGCGGSMAQVPDCAKSRLDQVASVVKHQSLPVTVHVTTRYCQPYEDYLRAAVASHVTIHCFDGGATTYHEFVQLSQRLDNSIPLTFVSSDYHAFRVKKLAEIHSFHATVVAAPSSTFRRVNCGLNCFLTVNLSNYDFFAKLTAEMLSYAVFVVSRPWVSWQAPEQAVEPAAKSA